MTEAAHINMELMQKYLDAGLIKETKHPSAELYIYNYTPKAQFDRVWDSYTMMCRGLICDKDGYIVARPFTKFFNIGENNQEIPNEKFVVTEKMDGSLGILYWLNDVPFIATRGSFSSDMAIEGTRMLWEYLGIPSSRESVTEALFKNHKFQPVPSGHISRDETPLFEIIYPANRIVVDYGSERRLVLLAVIDTQTGAEKQLFSYPDTVPIYQINSLNDLDKAAADNKEGFVVIFENGLRMKFKFDEYKRLHRILTDTSNREIWKIIAVDAMSKHVGELMSHGKNLVVDAKWIAIFLKPGISQLEVESILQRNGKALDSLLERVPDEFYNWLHQNVDNMRQKYDAVMVEALRLCDDFNAGKITKAEIATRKNAASAAALSLITGRAVSAEGIAWRAAYPEWELPFANDADA